MYATQWIKNIMLHIQNNCFPAPSNMHIILPELIAGYMEL